MWTISLQRRRLRSREPEDGEFPFRKWADFQFLIVGLTRLRRAASLAAKVQEIQENISNAIGTFDRALPNLKAMRDTAEHIDDYAVDAGRNSAIGRTALEVAVIGDENIEWLGMSLDLGETVAAAEALFEAVKSNVPSRDP